MGGFFGVAAKETCTSDLFFGTDYHSHLGTVHGGMAVRNQGKLTHCIHDIRNVQFRSRFDDDLNRLRGNWGIGVISDYEAQPLIIGSHLGTYAIVTVGVVANAKDLTRRAFQKRDTHFCEMSGSEINPTEIVATCVNKGSSFTEGLTIAQESIEGSCSILLLTEEGIYAARDNVGRTPVVLGRRDGAWAATMESSAFPNLDYEHVRDLGPGEIVRFTHEGVETMKAPGDTLRICSFLWVYYGYPSTSYETINVEACRNRCGAALARRDDVQADCAAGIPDSGTAHAIGYAAEAGIPYQRPFVKYTPTWPRSFMPQEQEIRNLVARMKLIPVPELIRGKSIVFCEDSIVRGTQLQDIVERLYDIGIKEIHMRPACPPLVFGCKYLNFSRSRSILDLATRKVIKEIEGDEHVTPELYADPDSEKYQAMVERIRVKLKLTSLRFQRLDDLIGAIGLPKERLCTYCWDGCDGCG
ncbi:MAG: amidophosphoribosyltransferase [Lentisphaeria bacterium]|nr:amidophosphoribosyltransferase [Lentisphaeria bacterium]